MTCNNISRHTLLMLIEAPYTE